MKSVADGLMRIRDRLAPMGAGRALLAFEIVLGLLLLVQLVRLVMILIAPGAASAGPPAAVAAPIDATVFQRFDAFFRTGATSSLAGAEAGPSQMRLFGVRSDGAGGGSAILGLADGRQVSAAVGETIEPGLVLHAVGADFVTLSRGGALSRLEFTEAPVGAAAPPPPPGGDQVVTPSGPTPPAAPATASVAPTAAPVGPAVDPKRFMAQASLRPRLEGRHIRGFVLNARGDGAVLRAAGLQSGDVIMAVNGMGLNSLERLSELPNELSNSSTAEIRFERGGREQTITIRTGS